MMEKFLINRIVGPILDVIGSKAREVDTVAGVTKYELFDKATGQIVGLELRAVRDGVGVIKSFTQPTELRKKIFGG